MNPKETDYVVFDVETTGLSAVNGDRIVEIAAIKVKNGQMVDTFESFVNPQRDIPIEAQRVNNITPDMVKDAPTAPEVLPRMIEFIGPSCLVGHNVKFDLDFLCFELSLASRRLRSETPVIDTLKMAKALVGHLPNLKLASIATSFGVRIGETHRALADVEITVGVLNRLIEKAYQQNIRTFKDLLKQFGVQKPNFKIEQAEQTSLF